jgi:hypothetical protein
VHSREQLRKRFDERLWRSPINYAIEINDAGLVFGAGTVLARMTRDRESAPVLALDKDRQRIFALLATAYGRTISSDVFRHIEGASDQWRKGDKALANIRLAYAHLPRLNNRADAFRLFHAEDLLERGVSPWALMLAFGFDPAAADLAKYDPNQPRVPAGSGKPSGEWTSGGGGAAEPAQAKPASVTITPVATAVGIASESGTLASGLFTAAAGSEFLTGLAALGVVVGAAAVFGTIFVPAPKSVTSEGPVPGDPKLRYSLDNDEGVLRFLHQSDAGKEVAAVARLGRDGIFFEVNTGIPIARQVGGSLVFDAAALANEATEPRTQVGADARASTEADTDKPQLCPDPGPDAPHGASARAIAYQAYISALNNPDRPLPPGIAVSLIDPTTGKRVVYDDCRESDGTMIEAKGPGYAQLLQYSYFYNDILPARWEKQATRQVNASGWRDVDWFFAEPEAEERAKEIFGRDEDRFGKIKVFYEPAGVQ